MQVPTEFAAAAKSLERIETFIRLAAAGQTAQVATSVASDFSLLHQVDRDGHTALIAAAATDQVDVIKLLAGKGANLNTQDVRLCPLLLVLSRLTSLPC